MSNSSRNFFLRLSCFHFSARDCTELFAAGFKESVHSQPSKQNQFWSVLWHDDGWWWMDRLSQTLWWVRWILQGLGRVQERVWWRQRGVLAWKRKDSSTDWDPESVASGNQHHIGKRYAKYSNFTVTNEATNYTLFVGFYSGNAYDRLSGHNGMAFSTQDRDNDKDSGNCAKSHRGAWWYESCFYSSLNSNFGDSSYSWNWNSLMGSQMKLKPKSPWLTF